MYLFTAFIAFWITLLPIYLWGFGVSYLLSDTWNRIRFWIGIFLGGMGVALTYIVSMLYQDYSNLGLLVCIGFIGCLVALVFIFTLFGSKFSRVFLRKIALMHAGIMTITLLCIYLAGRYLPVSGIITPLFYIFFLTPFLEEAAKHLGSVGLIGHEYKFSQRDILSFTFFIVLGFVFSENLLYLISGQFSLGAWIGRSFVTIIAHIFTAIICAHFWWKALSYPLFSWRYILTFFVGFILAGGLHLLYNYFIQQGSIIGLIAYCVVAYIIVFPRSYIAQQ